MLASCFSADACQVSLAGVAISAVPAPVESKFSASEFRKGMLRTQSWDFGGTFGTVFRPEEGAQSRRDGAIVAWHEVPGTDPPQKNCPVGHGVIGRRPNPRGVSRQNVRRVS